MQSYEQIILNYIIDHPGCTRKHVLHEYNHLSSKTIYLNIRKLIASKAIEEGSFGELKAVRDTKERTKDTWPIVRPLRDFENATEIINAYVCQDGETREKMIELSHNYGTTLALLAVNITILQAIVMNSDMYAGFYEKKPINRNVLEYELKEFETLLELVKEHLIITDRV